VDIITDIKRITANSRLKEKRFKRIYVQLLCRKATAAGLKVSIDEVVEEYGRRGYK